MNKKISLGSALSFLILSVAVTFTVTFVISMQYFNQRVNNITERENLYEKIQEIDSLIRTNYYEELDEKTVLNSICAGYVSGLGDKYSYFLSAEQYNRLMLSNAGSVVGIGATIEKDSSGYLTVTKVYKDSPAEAAEIQVNDTIVKIDNTDVVSLTNAEAGDLISGDAGTKVTLVIRRSGNEITQTIVRRKITLPSVEYRMIGDYGYIRILEFNAATVNQFNEALNAVRSQGAIGVIFDVRNNTGGTLSSVCEILDILLPKGTIAYKSNDEGFMEVVATSDDNELLLPMTCLVNENTASAAELFACALKDYDKASLVGTVTYGKGVMQTTFKLSDGSGVCLTTGYFYPPKSDNFNGTGLTPDYSVTLSAEQIANFETLDETTDTQLIKAIEVLSGKTIK